MFGVLCNVDNLKCVFLINSLCC